MNQVVMYLMNEKGYFVLEHFIREYNSKQIRYVLLAKDNNIKKDYYNELVSLCEKNNITYYNRKESPPDFSGYKFAIGWRWIIEDSNNLIVLHDSILPKYRGFAPLVNMLINGENEIGVTALFATEEYDKGDIIKQEIVSIEYPIKIQEAIKLIAPLYSKLVNSIAQLVFDNKEIVGVSQIEENATYSLWRDEQDYFIDWNADCNTIKRLVDAVGYPYSGAKTYLNNKIITIDDAEEELDIVVENRDVGKVVFLRDGYPVVVCGKGLLKIIKARFLDESSILPFNTLRSRFGK
ncbi:formyltransferase family protein [Geosporobacter ferrireducens]|uniref:Methionyl-tRNA formyltransferase n=1 Tax=Geosporobacter ferrireducens TaxID=1424294 RepID=A0A1D8GGL4_9FIRM|nr:formyltransferase family protein [Geosporobacter ferrireducens]AOT70023.1 hypothetical protein Gferi_10745 [Geosporobacter ferrireducens]MTI53432.1 methionyl-tRNA formyltransferase [Geosporobacter ferrireducens]